MIHVYTDGAYSSSRDQGGWSYVVLYKNQLIKKEFGGVKATTNNRMEILAVLNAVELFKNTTQSVNIYTDSMYVVGSLTLNWKRNTNLDLWEKFDKALAKAQKLIKVPIQFKHVKGHNGDIYNEKCDKLASNACYEI